MDTDRYNRERELRRMLKDPVGRIVLERKFFEATKSLAPEQDDELLIQVILEMDEVGAGMS